MLFSGILRLPIVFALQVARWQMARLPGCQVARWQVAQKIGKWGISEKSFQNVAQLRWNYLHRTLQFREKIACHASDFPPGVHIHVNKKGDGWGGSVHLNQNWLCPRPMVSVSPDPVPALHFHLKDHDHSSSAHVLWSTSIPLGPHSYPLKTPSASWFSLLFALAVLSAPATTIWWHPSRVQAYCPFPLCCQEWPTLTSIRPGAQVLAASPARATAATFGNA